MACGQGGLAPLCMTRCLAITVPMTLHLVKLCVGADLLDDLRQWMAARMAEARRRGAPLRHAHVTRMAPKRAADILDGGSLYWVIKGQISARQARRRHRAVHGRRRDRPLPALARQARSSPSRPARCAPSRAARLRDGAAPPDIDEAQPGFADMPEAMRRELAGSGCCSHSHGRACPGLSRP